MNDDIFLNKQVVQKKKGKKIALVFVILLILLIGTCGAYWYYTNYIVENYKTSFFEYLGQTNLSTVLDTDIYYTVLEKMNNESYETETTANFSTTMESDSYDIDDVSKLDFILKTKYDDSDMSYFDATINYSSNEILNVKLISTAESIGIGSSQVYDKYIATRKSEYSESIEKFTGEESETSIDEIDNILENIIDKKIDISDEYLLEKLNEYFSEVTDLLPEENFEKTESIVVTINSEQINAMAYTLTLDEEQYKEVLNRLVTKFTADTEFVDMLVTGNSTAEEEEETEPVVISPLTDLQVEYSSGEEETFEASVYVVGEDGETELESTVTSEDTTTATEETPATTEETTEQTETTEETTEETSEETSETEEEEADEAEEEENAEETEIIETTDISDSVITDTDINIEDIEFSLNLDFSWIENNNEDRTVVENLVYALVLKQKLDMTADELLSGLEEEMNECTGGLKITVYVRNEEEAQNETIKVTAEFEEDESVDIEYYSDNEFKLTTLNGNDGETLQISRTSSDVKNSFVITQSEIEDNTVIAKTEINLDTQGSKSSSSFTNELIYKYSNSEGNYKINVENSMDFQDVDITETLTEDNTLFIDDLSTEQAQNLYQEVNYNAYLVYQDIMSDLDFINTNSISSIIGQPTEDKETVKQKLVNTVGLMMTEYEQDGKTLTIQDLKNLKIDGYSISCTVTSEQATIVMGGYTFYIDKDFVLTEE